MATMVLYPYRTQWANEDVWVFDDKENELKAEAFVLGMSEMITRVVEEKGILDAEHGFKMTFSDKPFDGADIVVYWLEKGDLTWTEGKGKKKTKHVLPGNWYGGEVYGEVMVGWLCPALFKYFEDAPKAIYVGAEELPEGVDPIWHVPKEKGKRFVDVSQSLVQKG